MDNTADRYPNISDHGLIGDLQTAALVTTDGTIDWFCCPRFDSPSVFASLLDSDKGGYFRIAPDRDDYVSKQLYLPDNALLITRFMTADGVGEVQDFMPVIEGKATDRHRLVRRLRVARGVCVSSSTSSPGSTTAGRSTQSRSRKMALVFRSDSMDLTLSVAWQRDPSDPEVAVPERVGDGLRAVVTMHEGQIGGVVIESNGRPAQGHPDWRDHAPVR